MRDKSTKTTETDVSYYVECSFQNTLVELKKRLRIEGNLPRYTLGRHCTKFIVINDGGIIGILLSVKQLLFCQKMIVLLVL